MKRNIIIGLISLFFITGVIMSFLFSIDTGSSIGDGISDLFYALTIILGALFTVSWYKRGKRIVSLIPVLAILIIVFSYHQTQSNLHMPYFVKAIDQNDHSHQHTYYFREDGSVKVHAIWFWSESNDFYYWEHNDNVIDIIDDQDQTIKRFQLKIEGEENILYQINDEHKLNLDAPFFQIVEGEF
jgi:hypothetical protein